MGATKPFLSIYDKALWDSFNRGEFRLQFFESSGKFRYPPTPIDPDTSEVVDIENLDSYWKTVSGKGEIYSWCVFQRQYFDDYPAPYNVITVKLDDGAFIISNLVGDMPEGEWIGRRVEAVFEPYRDGKILRFRLAEH